jgi:prophage maintenance system killer protein
MGRVAHGGACQSGGATADRLAQMTVLTGAATLTVENVLAIYNALVEDFAAGADTMAPAGVRDQGLLESAVHRQQTGFDGHLKYYGLCCDHPFINGNKRTAPVAMLVHLDRNNQALHGVNQGQLYTLMMNVATTNWPTRRTGAGAPARAGRRPMRKCSRSSGGSGTGPSGSKRASA